MNLILLVFFIGDVLNGDVLFFGLVMNWVWLIKFIIVGVLLIVNLKICFCLVFFMSVGVDLL